MDKNTSKEFRRTLLSSITDDDERALVCDSIGHELRKDACLRAVRAFETLNELGEHDPMQYIQSLSMVFEITKALVNTCAELPKHPLKALEDTEITFNIEGNEEQGALFVDDLEKLYMNLEILATEAHDTLRSRIEMAKKQSDPDVSVN